MYRAVRTGVRGIGMPEVPRRSLPFFQQGVSFPCLEHCHLVYFSRLGVYARRSAVRLESRAPSVPGPDGRGPYCAVGQEMGIQPGITVPDIPIPNPAAVREAGTGGRTVLVNPDTAGAMAMNQTGALVWKLVNGRRTAVEITAAVRNHFPDAPDSVAEDVRALLTKLAEEGFIGWEIPLKGAH